MAAPSCDLGDHGFTFLVSKQDLVQSLLISLFFLAEIRSAHALRLVHIFLLFGIVLILFNAQGWALTPAEHATICSKKEGCLVSESDLHDEVVRDLIRTLVQRSEGLACLGVLMLIQAVILCNYVETPSCYPICSVRIA